MRSFDEVMYLLCVVFVACVLAIMTFTSIVQLAEQRLNNTTRCAIVEQCK